ncbi:hypothetical protein C0J45_19936 [Silurus meridionalis]|nr:hypothetical protein C0J45_19936 [Silurus meridionalis]
MELNPPPPYPGSADPTFGVTSPPFTVAQDIMYPAPPKYSAAVVQPVPTIMQPDFAMVQSTTVIQSQPVMVSTPDNSFLGKSLVLFWNLTNSKLHIFLKFAGPVAGPNVQEC